MALPNLAPESARPRPAPGAADMRPCRRCGQTNPRRMIALMSLWFGQYAGFRPEAGYFYLCPACYQSCIAPHTDEVLHHLAEAHPARHVSAARPLEPPPPGAFS